MQIPIKFLLLDYNYGTCWNLRLATLAALTHSRAVWNSSDGWNSNDVYTTTVYAFCHKNMHEFSAPILMEKDAASAVSLSFAVFIWNGGNWRWNFIHIATVAPLLPFWFPLSRFQWGMCDELKVGCEFHKWDSRLLTRLWHTVWGWQFSSSSFFPPILIYQNELYTIGCLVVWGFHLDSHASGNSHVVYQLIGRVLQLTLETNEPLSMLSCSFLLFYFFYFFTWP